jgi:hypothetical protein
MGWRALAIGFVWGLGLGNHLTLLLCAPLFMLALWRLDTRRAYGVAGILVGLAVYLYLPVRAVRMPPINWGNPSSLGRLWWMVSGAFYRPFVFALPPEYLGVRVASWTRIMARQLGWLGVPLVVLGGATFWRRDRSLFWATMATSTLCSVFAVGYDTSDSFLYLIPALVCFVLWLAVGARWVLDWLKGVMQAHAWAPTLWAVLVVLLPVVGALVGFPAQNLRADRTAQVFGRAVLDQAPDRAILLTEEDAHTFALWYYRYAVGERPDVAVVDLGLLTQEWYAAQLAPALGAPLAPGLGREEGRLQAAQDLERPVCILVSRAPELACLNPSPKGE